jgi:hypothetical protein
MCHGMTLFGNLEGRMVTLMRMKSLPRRDFVALWLISTGTPETMKMVIGIKSALEHVDSCIECPAISRAG